ncbi:hypothetical protein L211DRAFT_496918 [Terfezia boudieri ATCC MYA-4762]|uniref:Uncharacterized protein n=1 Tax=Terfezia boudieri ATCC MYA-4762 TaxID=1051890 RepID=A0A3N4LH82_9PEZI|nr:hypothetical protein L211DRAFT_496918 [Terfezia boudieri ATCC MYA-4762]
MEMPELCVVIGVKWNAHTRLLLLVHSFLFFPLFFTTQVLAGTIYPTFIPTLYAILLSVLGLFIHSKHFVDSLGQDLEHPFMEFALGVFYSLWLSPAFIYLKLQTPFPNPLIS